MLIRFIYDASYEVSFLICFKRSCIFWSINLLCWHQIDYDDKAYAIAV